MYHSSDTLTLCAVEETATITITVSAKEDDKKDDEDKKDDDKNDTPVAPPAADSGKGGCGSTSVSDITFIGGASLMGIGILFAVTRVLRKKKEN